MKKYQITLTERQLDIVGQALDLYMRIGIGQFHEMLQVFHGLSKRATPDSEHYMNIIKQLETGHGPNASFGIHSPEVKNKFRQAFDICQAVRYRLAHDRSPGGYSVHHNEPLKSSTDVADKIPIVNHDDSTDT